MAVPLSTIPGSKDKMKLDQGPIRSMKGIDFINGRHGDACGEKFQASALSVPELRVIEPHLEESEKIDSANGPAEKDVPPLVPRSSFLPYSVLDDPSAVCLEAKGIDRRLMSDDELSGDWPSLLRIALSHLGGLSQLKFWDAKNKLCGRVIEHRVWIELEELQQRPCWLVKVEATHKSPFDALQDAAILAVITMRLHFPREFQDTPFMVLPMVPGQRSRLDYPAVGGGAVAATSMGVDSKDVEHLQRKCFTSYFRERHEYCDRLREHNLKTWQLIADYSNVAEEFILCPTGMPEMRRRKAELSKRSDDMWVVPDDAVLGDCGWSVFISNKALQQREAQEMKQLEDGMQQLTYPTAASSRARL